MVVSGRDAMPMLSKILMMFVQWQYWSIKLWTLNLDGQEKCRHRLEIIFSEKGNKKLDGWHVTWER